MFYNMEFFPGAVAGLTTAILGYPFDTIKTRMQISNGSTTNILFNMIKNNGISSVYRGVTIPLISNVIKRSYQYYIFEDLKQKNINPYLSGSISGISGSLIGCPMHVIKANLQATDKNKYKNASELIKRIYKNEGWKGFYKGFYINLFKDALYGGFYLGNYTLLKNFIPQIIYNKEYTQVNDYQKKFTHFLAGGFSAVFIWGIFIPIDHIETAIQTDRGIDYIINKVKKNNFFILWRGSFPILIRIFPVSAISMLNYELTLSIVNKKYI